MSKYIKNIREMAEGLQKVTEVTTNALSPFLSSEKVCFKLDTNKTSSTIFLKDVIKYAHNIWLLENDACKVTVSDEVKKVSKHTINGNDFAFIINDSALESVDVYIYGFNWDWADVKDMLFLFTNEKPLMKRAEEIIKELINQLNSTFTARKHTIQNVNIVGYGIGGGVAHALSRALKTIKHEGLEITDTVKVVTFGATRTRINEPSLSFYFSDDPLYFYPFHFKAVDPIFISEEGSLLKNHAFFGKIFSMAQYLFYLVKEGTQSLLTYFMGLPPYVKALYTLHELSSYKNAIAKLEFDNFENKEALKSILDKANEDFKIYK